MKKMYDCDFLSFERYSDVDIEYRTTQWTFLRAAVFTSWQQHFLKTFAKIPNEILWSSSIHLLEAIQLTQLLLVKAAFNEPDYIRLYRERFDARVKGKFANQFRKELGNRFSMFVEDAPHWIQKPLLPTQYVENYLRKFQLTVQHMYRNKKFDCNAIAELYITPLSHHFYPDARATFACTRVLGARSFSHGQILHRSMESGLPVEALGRLVIDDHSGDVIALQIEEVCDVIDEGIDDDQ